MSVLTVAEPPQQATGSVTLTREAKAIKTALAEHLSPEVRRVVVVAAAEHPDAYLAAILRRLMVIERLDLEVAYVAPAPTAATAVYGLPTGPAAHELAASGLARSMPLIRDDTGQVLVGRARQRAAAGKLTGETYVDSERLFNGTAPGVIVEPLTEPPGVRGRLDRRWRAPWLAGRAVQTGGLDLHVERDGIAADRIVPRSTFYRHTDNWNLVCP